ncbi:hypothetical protein [Streptosporangium sp. NPDC003464]
MSVTRASSLPYRRRICLRTAGRWPERFACSWATVMTSGGAARATIRFRPGRVPMRTPRRRERM